MNLIHGSLSARTKAGSIMSRSYFSLVEARAGAMIKPSCQNYHTAALRPSQKTLSFTLTPYTPKLTPVLSRFVHSKLVKEALTKTGVSPSLPQATSAAQSVDASSKVGEETAEDYLLFHPVYSQDELVSVKYTHEEVKGLRSRLAHTIVNIMRFFFDYFTGYSEKIGAMTEQQWLNRIVFLETVAGVPGFVAAMIRHMRSLRLLKRDNGWIHTLLEEAENERMHLLTFMKLKQPGFFFRGAVLGTQGVFFNAYFFCYLLDPKACHRFVGYLEESAVKTYTHCIEDIEHGSQIKHWGVQPAPEIARQYWRLAENATVKDVVMAVRADEADHRDTNHALAKLNVDDPNPFN